MLREDRARAPRFRDALSGVEQAHFELPPRAAVQARAARAAPGPAAPGQKTDQLRCPLDTARRGLGSARAPTTSPEVDALRILDVHAHLDDPAAPRQPEAERADAGEAPALLQHDRCDRARDVDVVRGQVHVERDERPARAHEHVLVGARRPLVAFNVNLATDDIDVARAIAAVVREKGGGFPGVGALGFGLPSRGIVQVSMNVEDPERVDLHEVVARVRAEAAARGVETADWSWSVFCRRARRPRQPEPPSGWTVSTPRVCSKCACSTLDNRHETGTRTRVFAQHHGGSSPGGRGLGTGPELPMPRPFFVGIAADDRSMGRRGAVAGRARSGARQARDNLDGIGFDARVAHVQWGGAPPKLVVHVQPA